MLEGYRSSSCAQVATRSPCPSVVRPLSVLGIPPVTMLGCFYRRRSELEPSQNVLSLSVLGISPVQPSAFPSFPNNESPITNNDFSPTSVLRPLSVLDIPPVTMLGCFYRRRSESEPSQNVLSLFVLGIPPVQPSVVRHPSSVLCPSSVFLLCSPPPSAVCALAYRLKLTAYSFSALRRPRFTVSRLATGFTASPPTACLSLVTRHSLLATRYWLRKLDHHVAQRIRGFSQDFRKIACGVSLQFTYHRLAAP